MKKRKSYLIPTLYLLALFSITIGLYFTKKAYDSFEVSEDFNNITFVSSTILNRTVPIINVSDKIVNPYGNVDVKIARYFYKSSLSLDEKKLAIVFYGNTYMPNTGIDYVYEDIFDVLNVYDGTVVDVMNDELLGKTVKIRHNSEIISVYQGLNNIEVVKGDTVFKGQKIGESGTSKLNNDLGNHLHFEIYKSGITIDPLSCIGKELGDI